MRNTTTRPRYNNIENRDTIASLQGGRPMLYAMRVKGGLIKIGCSRNIGERRRNLTGELLAMAPGDFADELAIHQSLAGHAHHGREYYNPTPEVLAVVNELREYFKLDPLAA